MSRSARLRRGAALLATAALAAAACTPGASSDDEEGSGDDTAAGEAADTAANEALYPGREWARGAPSDAGFEPAILRELADDAGANGSNCLVVTRHGRLVVEWYWNGTDAGTTQEVFSATKSFGSTLVGIAQADGDLDIRDPAAEYIPEWAGTPSAEVTVEDLLSNDSGRHWDASTDYQRLPASADRTGYAIGLAQDAPPGTVWAYNNAAIQTLDAVLEAATGEEPADYAEERLFEPLGMHDTEMTRDGAGNTNIFFGLQSSCRDLARFGYLFLRRGHWDGTEIVPEDWVEAATGRPSQDLNAAYGYLWWLNRNGPVADPLRPTTAEEGGDVADGQLVPEAPEDMYWALGLGGQVLQVDPGSGTVVVRLGEGVAQASYGPANTARVVTQALIDP